MADFIGSTKVGAESSYTSGGTNFLPPGQIHVNTTQAATAANTDETLFATFTLPAGTLKDDGDKLVFKVFGTSAANANAKTMRLRLNSISGTQIGYFAGSINNTPWEISVTTIRTSATAIKSYGLGISQGVSGQFSRYSTDTVTLSGAVTFVVTGENGAASASDIVFEGLTVDYYPAPI